MKHLHSFARRAAAFLLAAVLCVCIPAAAASAATTIGGADTTLIPAEDENCLSWLFGSKDKITMPYLNIKGQGLKRNVTLDLEDCLVGITYTELGSIGSFVSASCSCPYNENGEGPCCKHIGALLMRDSESQGLSGRAPQRPSESPESIPGVVRGTANLQTPQPEEPPRRDSYASSLEMLFGKKWRGEEPESDYEARRLLQAYQEGALAEVDGVTGHAELRPHSAELEPELTLLPGELPWLRLRISVSIF